jgi:hypothetical protein
MLQAGETEFSKMSTRDSRMLGFGRGAAFLLVYTVANSGSLSRVTRSYLSCANAGLECTPPKRFEFRKSAAVCFRCRVVPSARSRGVERNTV